MGGNAFPLVGAIHLSEIESTVTFILNKLNVTESFCLLGSSGKKEWSGDIDIALDVPTERQIEIFNLARRILGEHLVRKGSGLLSMAVSIQNYNSTLESNKKRTSTVQIDIMFGNLSWLALFYHSPVYSKLKGVHRNIAISALAGYTQREEDSYLDGFDRPICIKRWKWSPNTGLSRVVRVSKRDRKNWSWVKKQSETNLSDPLYDANAIANILFFGKLGVEYLDSLESVVDAIKILYSEDIQALIFKTMAFNLNNISNVRKYRWEYPLEINRYITLLE